MENKARVIAEHKGVYKVKNENGEFLAKVTGKQMFDALSREDYPAVGDWVIIDELLENLAVIKEILPRKTIIKRKQVGKESVQIIATNIDVAFIVESVGRDYNLNRFERYFSLAKDGGVKPVVVLNKIDLISNDELQVVLAQLKDRFPDIGVIPTSVVEDSDLSELKDYIESDKVYCFLGSSGVGKSSLINKLIGKDVIKTENVGSHSARGVHATTSRQMYFLPARAGGESGGVVVDNPGMRQVGMADVSEGIDTNFDEITKLSPECKYNDCTHTHEKSCKVLSAIESGEIAKDKYLNYLSLKKESNYYEMSEINKRQKERSFGKFISGAKKSLKKYGHKI